MVCQCAVIRSDRPSENLGQKMIFSYQRSEVNLNTPRRVAMTACVCGGTLVLSQTHAVTAAGLLMISITTAYHGLGYEQLAKFADSDQLTPIHN